MSNNVQTFDQVLSGFIASVGESKKLALQASVMALAHFAEHGDVAYLQRFYDALKGAGKNFVRSQAFLAWTVTHAPIALVEGKLKKDKARKDMIVDLKLAQDKPFWDFKPEPEIKDMSAADLVNKLRAVIKLAENTEKVKLSEGAERLLTKAKKAVNELAAAA